MSILVEGRTIGLLVLLVMAFLLWYFMNQATKGKVESVRRLPVMDAMEEAVGRSVEMGRPVLATYSYPDNLTPAILVGLEMVGYVSKIATEKGAEMLIPVGGGRTFPIAVENYRVGCIEAGRPELFKEENVKFLTHQQWAYGSGVMGLMERENPGACIFMGPFLVEGIHFGVQTQRIKTVGIGGVERYDMGAFMFITMNYTILGSELFAAGAYMSEDPVIISGIATEDVLKWIIGILVILGSILKATGIEVIMNLFRL